MTKIIDKIVKSKYPPKQTNVTWIDTSQKPAVTKSYIDGAWVVVGGGGGTKKYSDLEEKPLINGVELDGNKTSQDLGVYSKPSSGIPQSDLAQSVQTSLGKADTAYQKPLSGIPESDLSSDVQQALQKHFKGWLTSTSQLPDNPVVGDYAYVEDNDTTYIYRCTTNGEWPATSTEEKEPADVTFAGGEEVNETYIDNTHLVNPADGALPTAADTMQLAAKLQGITMEETKYDAIYSGDSQNTYSGYVDSSTGQYHSSTSNYFIVVPVDGIKRVRFLGGSIKTSATYTMGYSFGNITSGTKPDSTLSNYTPIVSQEFERKGDTNIQKEYVVQVPDNVTWMAISVWKTIIGESFYCYLQSGESILDILDSKIVKHVGFNLYDGNGNIYTSDGITYKRNCLVNIDSANNTKLTLSCNAAGGSYLYDTTFTLNDGSVINATITSSAYSSSHQRYGNRYNIPSNAIAFSFQYRITPASGQTQDLVRDVMVSYGTSVVDTYYPYEVKNIIANPYFTPYTDEVKLPVYIAPDGNDVSGDGSIANPFKTLNKALLSGKDILMRGGIYEVSDFCLLSNSPYNRISIKAHNNEKPIIFGGNKIATSATLISGSSKVYEKTIDDPNCNWLFQWGIPDESTLIPDNERVAYHGNRLYRMELATHIERATSIQQIEDSDDYMFYYDTTAGKIYFSCPQVPSSDNFIYCGLDYFFKNHSGKEIELIGLTFVGTSCNLGPVDEITGGWGCKNSKVESCTVYGTRQACFNMNNCTNITFINCEAAWSDSAKNAGGNDGFNAHAGTDYSVTATVIDCWSHDNGNDGYSDHERCAVRIKGGLFEHNSRFGTGCGITPAYGACDVVENVISQFNNSRGIGYFGVTNSTKCGAVFMNCVSRNNVSDGFYLSDVAFVEMVNCITYNNSRGIRGSSSMNINAVNCQSFNNTNADINVDKIPNI